MIWLAFYLHVLFFLVLLFVINFKKSYFNPVYFLIYANYFYFFILWILWYFVDETYIFKYQVGYYTTILFGFVMGSLYFKLIFNKYFSFLYNTFNKVIPTSYIENISLEKIFLMFLFLFLILLIFQYITFNTLNPIEVLIQIESKRQLGVEYQGIIPYIKKPIHLLMDLLFCFIVYKSLLYKKYKYICISLVLFIYLAIAFGSKSAVVMPLFYLAIIKHNFLKPIPLRKIIFFSIFVLLFIVIFQLIRLGLFEEINYKGILHTLVGRINMELYLTKYFNEGFNIDYPNSLKHFFYILSQEIF